MDLVASESKVESSAGESQLLTSRSKEAKGDDKSITLSGHLLLLTDLNQKKPSKRYFQLCDNILREYKSVKSNPIASYLLTSQSSVSKIDQKLQSVSFLCVSLNKKKQIYLVASSQYIARQWITAIDMAINATKVKLYWKVDYKEVKFETGQNGMRVILGQGSSTIYKGTYHGQVVAVKEFSAETSRFETEVTMLTAMKHKNIIDLIGACVPGPDSTIKKYALLQPLVEYGSLHDVLHGHSEKAKPLSWSVILKILFEIADALDYLHTFNLDGQITPIIHRDLKPSNILISSLDPSTNKPIVLISDLGLSRNESMVQTSQVGFISYMAPEMISSNSYGTAVDIFSFAVCIWQMVTRKIPYNKESVMKVHQFIVSGQRLTIPEYVPKSVADLITICWAEKPEARPSARAIMDMVSSLNIHFISRGSLKEIVEPSMKIPELKGKKSSLLYGRETAITCLLSSVNNWKYSGTSEIILITGDSGMGKTSFLERITDYAKIKGFCGYGKWYKNSHIPYAGIVQALSTCLSVISSWTKEETEQFKNKLVLNLGVDGFDFLIELLPELVDVLKITVKGTAAHSEGMLTHWVLLEFIKCLSTPGHPLLLSFDDIQWADQCSLELLGKLVDISNLLLTCCYNPALVVDSIPFSNVMHKFESAENAPNKIHLQPFTTKETKELVSDFTGGTVVKLDDFCDYLVKISRGNPFNIWFFLNQPKVKFIINNSISIDKPYFFNAMESMSADAHRLVHLLSFVIQPFSFETIVAVCNGVGIGRAKESKYTLVPVQSGHEKTKDEVLELIKNAVSLGMLREIEDQPRVYSFSHDKILEIVHEGFEDKVNVSLIAYQIAKLLFKFSQNSTPLNPYHLAHYFCVCADAITDSNEKLSACKAIMKGAYLSAKVTKDFYTAYTFCSLCVDLLGLKFGQEDSTLWKNEHELMWSLHDIMLQCHKHRVEVRAGNKVIQQLGRNAKSKQETGRVLKEMIDNIHMKTLSKDTLILILDFLHFLGLRHEILTITEIYANSDKIQEIKTEIVKACAGDLSAAIIANGEKGAQKVSPEIEDLHYVLIIGLEASFSISNNNAQNWILYEIVNLYLQNPGLKRQLKPCLLLAMELEQEGFNKLAGKIIEYCRPFVLNIGSLPHQNQVQTLEIVTYAYWSEYSALYMINNYINVGINIAIEINSFSHLAIQFVNRFVMHFAMGSWNPDSLVAPFQLPLAKKITSISPQYLLLFDVYANFSQIIKTNNPLYWKRAQGILQELNIEGKSAWAQSFLFLFAEVIYDNGLEVLEYVLGKGLLSDNSSWRTGTYIDPFVWWCCSVLYYRQILRIQVYHSNRANYLEKARKGLAQVTYAERGGGNFTPHICLLNALDLRVQMNELGNFDKKKQKLSAEIIMQFNNSMTFSRETNNAWIYALACECAAEFFEDQNLATLSKSHLEEALTAYTTLEATTKIKTLQVMLQNTYINIVNPLSIQNSSLEVIIKASQGLSSHYKDILQLSDLTLRETKLRDFQEHVDTMSHYLNDLYAKSKNIILKKETMKKVDLHQCVEGLCGWISHCHSIEVVPLFSSGCPEIINGNIETFRTLLMVLLIGFISSITDYLKQIYLFVNVTDKKNETQVHFHMLDYYPTIFPWNATEDNTNELIELPSDLQHTIETLSADFLSKIQLSSTYANNLGKTAFNVKFTLHRSIDNNPIGVGMKLNSLAEKMVTQYLKEYGYDFLSGIVSEQGDLSFHPSVPSIVIIDESVILPENYTSQFKTKVVLITTDASRRNDLATYDSIHVSNLSRLISFVKENM